MMRVPMWHFIDKICSIYDVYSNTGNVAELADALGLGPSGSNPLRVQVSPFPPSKLLKSPPLYF